MNSHFKFLIFCVIIFSTTLTTSATNDDASLLKLQTEAKQFAEHITHCQFTFGPLPFNSPEEIQSPQKRWESTRQEATSNMATSCEVPVDYRISTPMATAIQKNFSIYYMDNTTTLPKKYLDYLPENMIPANDPGLSEKQLVIVLKKMYRKNKMVTTVLLNGTEQTTRSLPFFKRELRLMNHRYCLFRLMGDLRDKAARIFYFMPGFIGYNKGVAKSMLALYTDLKNDELIDAIINGEHALDQVKTVSSSALHGNLLGSDGKAALYFIVHAWDKSLPECEDNLQPAHVMVKKGNDMERALPICRPKWLTRVSDILAATTTENTAETTPSTAQTEPPSPDHTEESPDHTEESPDHTEESPEQTEETPPSDEPEE
uniref:Secreted protein n=1 Tax=Globodera pallida TaxID=36090 RepID=A0A183BQT5_GLOPA